MRIELSDVFAPPGGRLPARPLFAVGDIHGHLDPLVALLEHLYAYIPETYGDTAVDLVFLGDYVDRGPEPLGVLECLQIGLDLPNVRQTNLLGNHDWFLAEAAELFDEELDAQGWSTWLANGGEETLEGAGLRSGYATPQELREALGPSICALLRELDYSFRSGDVLCVHAGVEPGTPLEAQKKRDLLWIREPFLSWDKDPNTRWEHPVTVVHGHSPHANGVFSHRIGVDTGGFSTGVFTVLELNETEGRFHRAVVA